ncbi:MAG: hypothetical protein ACRDUS_04580 [Mycobacterium sp.]
MTHPHDPYAMRATLRTDLAVAMKARNSRAVSALRTTIAAIDNAESVDPSEKITPGNAHIEGAATGLGAAEATRRVLSPADVRAILQAQIDDRAAEADRYDSLGQAEAAGQLRGEAEVLTTYL